MGENAVTASIMGLCKLQSICFN